MNFILSCFRYLFDFCFFGVCSFLMFLAFLTQAPQAVQRAELRTIMMPRIKIHDQEIQTSALLQAGDSDANVFCSENPEEMQLNFLLPSGDISGCDIKALNNFDRLKAQSKRTIHTLIENRRRLAQRASSARIRKERLKLSSAAWRARRCRS